jgi:AcrR family transcriptional regulator
MNPNRDNLLASLRDQREDTAARNHETRALIQRAGTLEKAREWLSVFEQFLPPGAEGSLREVLQFALLGLCLGFVERDLSPFMAEHLAIVPPLLDDVRSVFEQASARGFAVEPEEFRFRAFDYGVHKATYLDWTLYMSKECY